MSVLHHQKIVNLLETYHLMEDYDLENVGPASYELRIGSALNISDGVESTVEIGEEFAVRPNSHILLGTIEKVAMPDFLVGTMFLKSRFGRGGFLPWGQGFVDPGYEGNLTISLLNLSPHPYIFRGGEKICHIIFQNLEAATDKLYDGVYKGSEGASGPKEKPIKVFGDVINAGVTGIAAGLAQAAVTNG